MGGSARFTFSELCNQVLGAADYIAVAQAFHTVFLTDIPTMSLKVSPTPHPHTPTSPSTSFRQTLQLASTLNFSFVQLPMIAKMFAIQKMVLQLIASVTI